MPKVKVVLARVVREMATTIIEVPQGVDASVWLRELYGADYDDDALRWKSDELYGADEGTHAVLDATDVEGTATYRLVDEGGVYRWEEIR